MLETSSASFQDHAQRLSPLIESALVRYTEYGPDCPERLAAAIRHSLLAPGKRLRPLLVLMAAEACGGRIEAAIPAACAVEMVHTYSLIHDDLPAMDDDDLRRGRPTCHKAFDEATAILAGDALLAQAFEVLSSGIFPAETAGICCGELAAAAGACRLVGGQAADLAAENSQGTLAELEFIHRRKTGAMFLVSLRLGGLTAGASGEQLAVLSRYGSQLGLAFQIVDDLLDCDGKTSEVGKTIGKDRQQGKLTFPRLLGEEESRRRAAELIAGACEAANRFGASGAPLESLAQFVLQRNR